MEHVQRRDKDEATRNILQMTVDGKQNRGRNTEMAIPGEKGYGRKPDDRKHWHVMIQASRLQSVEVER